LSGKPTSKRRLRLVKNAQYVAGCEISSADRIEKCQQTFFAAIFSIGSGF